MKKEYLVPAMECLDVQTSTICEGSSDSQIGVPDVKPLSPRHL